MVGAAGIEPAAICSQSRCAAAALRSELAASPMPTAPATTTTLCSCAVRTPSRPQSRQRPEVGSGRCRSGVGLNVVFREPLVASGMGFIERLGDARKKLSVRVPVVIVNVCRWLSEHPGREGFVLLLSVAEIARGQ